MTTDSLCSRIMDDPHAVRGDAELRAHAAACPACGPCAESVALLGERLGAGTRLGAAMPDAMRAAMLSQLANCPSEADVIPLPARRHVPLWRRLSVPATLAATLALGMVIGRGFGGGEAVVIREVPRTIGQYISDVTHDHYLIERIGRPLEVSMADEAELSGWLSNSLNFAVDLPARDPAFALEGGRVWHTVGRLSAMASYIGADGSRVILFAVPAEGLQAAGASTTTVDGTEVFTGGEWEREARVWIEGDLAMALVAPDGHMPEDWARVFLP